MRLPQKFLVLPTVVAVALMAATGTGIAQPAPYPSRAITFVVPFPPGGVTDATARLAARKLSEDLKQPVIVENKPGAAGTIGAGSVARAEPDGYTLLVGSMANMIVNPNVFKERLTYRAVGDFAPVYGLMAMPIVITAKAGSPYTSLPQLFEAARTQPDKITYASSGSGSVSHLTAELMQGLSGTKLIHVPYKGSTPAVTDLLAGSVDIAFDHALTTAPHINAGKMLGLAVTGSKRLPSLRNVPTVAELGMPAAEVTSWLALYAPLQTPQPIVEKLTAAMSRVLKDPAVVDGLVALGGDAMPLDPAALRRMVDTEDKRWKPVIEKAGVLPN